VFAALSLVWLGVTVEHEGNEVSWFGGAAVSGYLGDGGR
jgi:hypothetical protein